MTDIDIRPADAETDDGPGYRHLYDPLLKGIVAVCGYIRDYAFGTRDQCPKCPKCLEIQKQKDEARFN